MIDASLDELMHISVFLRSHSEAGSIPKAVLIGGWAVHS